MEKVLIKHKNSAIAIPKSKFDEKVHKVYVQPKSKKSTKKDK